MALLLADENRPFPVVRELRRLGHGVKTLSDFGQADSGFADDAVLRLACQEKRAVVTINRRDFVRLHRASPAHYGIVVCTTDLNFAGQAARIDREIRAADSLAGTLIRINRPSG